MTPEHRLQDKLIEHRRHIHADAHARVPEQPKFRNWPWKAAH
jgi:hypothetical protein